MDGPKFSAAQSATRLSSSAAGDRLPLPGNSTALTQAATPAVSTRRARCARLANPVNHGFMSTESAIEFIRPDDLASQVPCAYAAVVGPGRAVFTAGACPLDLYGATVAVGDVAGQARQVMANLVATLGAAGTELGDVVKTTVYVASALRQDLVIAWEVVREVFGDHDAPSTLVGVSVLGYEDQLVEVEAIAVRPA
jgi:enamine deaminase RidA (YjgF/YER057c/UK114 family)